MGTKNPKVSAYVPQPLKDRIEEFTREHKVSESQLVTQILAEYFQMPEVLGRSPEGLGIGNQMFARMEALEEKVSNVISFVEERLQKLGKTVQDLSSPQVDYHEPPKDNKDNFADSELTGTPLGELPVEEVEPNKTAEVNDTSSEPPSSLLSNLLLLPEEMLAQRLGCAKGTLKNRRTQSSQEEFTKWSLTKDVADIPWRSLRKGKSIFYEPNGELTSDQEKNLLDWLKQCSTNQTTQ